MLYWPRIIDTNAYIMWQMLNSFCCLFQSDCIVEDNTASITDSTHWKANERGTGHLWTWGSRDSSCSIWTQFRWTYVHSEDCWDVRWRSAESLFIESQVDTNVVSAFVRLVKVTHLDGDFCACSVGKVDDHKLVKVPSEIWDSQHLDIVTSLTCYQIDVCSSGL